MNNVDINEIEKFDRLSEDWWNAEGSLKTLHIINPVRLDFIQKQVSLANTSILDVGCGGGILSEALAGYARHVTAIDMSSHAISAAIEHAKQTDVSNIDYIQTNIELFAENHSEKFDVISCMEMLEHVPDPFSVISACEKLLKPGGSIFLSTLNRQPASYLKAILLAEHLLKLLPKGTHDYAHFIKPSELFAQCRQAGLSPQALTGLHYIPYLDRAYLSSKTDTNYMLHAAKPE